MRESGEKVVKGREHFRRLERLYLAAPTNVYYKPHIAVSEGRTRISICVRDDFFHAASAVHGSVYFKMLDDAAFFAVHSAVEDFFVVTTSFSVTFVRPISSGEIIAHGLLVHASRRLFVGESEIRNEKGQLLGKGSGTFMRSRIKLGPEVGYI